MRQIYNSDLQIEFEGKTVTLHPNYKFSQVDGLVLKKITGLGGAFCLICYVDEKSASNPEVVKNGFLFERTNNESVEFYEKNHSRLSKMKSKDRYGMTSEPLLKYHRFNVDLVICPLHCWINTLTMFENIAYMKNAIDAFPNGLFRGRGQTTTQKNAIESAKDHVRFKAKHGELNLPLDQPDPSGSGGSTDTGKLFYVTI